MKIGIITVQDVCNFGSFLQAYALQLTLQEMGHEVSFLRSSSEHYVRGLFYRIRPYGNEWKHLPSFIMHNYKGWKKRRLFLKDQKLLGEIIDEYDDNFDLIILGSDEIWNVQNPLFKNDIFYGVGMKNVIAYGASIGAASSSDMTCIPVRYFENMKRILARDENTQEFLKGIHISSERVCDPTFLIDADKFKRPYHSKLISDGKYVLIYAYGHEFDDSMKKAIVSFARTNELRVLSVCFELDWCDDTIQCSPLDFCSVIDAASFVITATFHGTIFSILNHKQFVSMPHSIKTTDLLQSLKLSERILENSNFNEANLSEKLVNNIIDYNKVDSVIMKQRDESRKLLERTIQNNS